jgi:hypothetical protein
MTFDGFTVPAPPEAASHPVGGLMEWVTTVDHKKIGTVYISPLWRSS